MNGLKVELQGATDIGAAQVVYVDSRVALDRAYQAGLSRDAEVRSTAPGLLVGTDIDARQADAHLASKDIWALDAAFTALHRDCKGAFGDADIELIIARYATLELQNLSSKAALLEEEDFSRPVTVIDLTSEDPDLDRMIRTPFGHLLASNPDLTVLTVPIESLPRRDDPRPPSPSFRQRLSFSGFSTIAYRLLERLSTCFRLAGPRGRIIILRENELCKETAFAMMLRGYMPVTVPVSITTPDTSFTLDPAHADTCRQLVHQHLGPLIRAKSAIDPLADKMIADVSLRIHRYRESFPVWKRRLQGLVRPGRTATLTNWLNDPEALALKQVLHDQGVPMVFFQHGVTNEINWRMRQYEAQFGTSVCDLEMAFNDQAVVHSMNNRFRRGRAFATGFPGDYYRGMRRTTSVASEGPPIWYVCTAIYVANHGQLEGVTDWEKYRHESDIVTEVLAKCDHRVIFKPYPGRRFEDPDPIETAVENSPNIDMHRSRIDLRYVVGKARVLISSRSFSTPSWCLATGLPMVHIDIPDQDPLDEEARKAFEEGVFLFDSSDADFHAKLLAFLNQPIEEIERQWAAKAEARKQLMQRFMSSAESGAGARAAREIIREIKQRRG